MVLKRVNVNINDDYTEGGQIVIKGNKTRSSIYIYIYIRQAFLDRKSHSELKFKTIPVIKLHDDDDDEDAERPVCIN